MIYECNKDGRSEVIMQEKGLGTVGAAVFYTLSLEVINTHIGKPMLETWGLKT